MIMSRTSLFPPQFFEAHCSAPGADPFLLFVVGAPGLLHLSTAVRTVHDGWLLGRWFFCFDLIL